MACRSRVIYDVLSYRCNYCKKSKKWVHLHGPLTPVLFKTGVVKTGLKRAFTQEMLVQALKSASVLAWCELKPFRSVTNRNASRSALAVGACCWAVANDNCACVGRPHRTNINGRSVRLVIKCKGTVTWSARKTNLCGRVHSPENRGDLSDSCLHVHIVQLYLWFCFIRLPNSPKISNLPSRHNWR
jgi:hypothetical protein